MGLRLASNAARARCYAEEANNSSLIGRDSMEATSSGGLNLISPVPGLVLTILFTAGRIGAEIETATAQQQQALFDYLPTIQTGLREVEDSLIATRRSGSNRQSKTGRFRALQRTLRLATFSLPERLFEFLEVLDAQRSLFSVELQRSRLGAIVNLYKAMGWWLGAMIAVLGSCSHLDQDRSSSSG